MSRSTPWLVAAVLACAGAGASPASAAERLIVLQKYAEVLSAYDAATGERVGPVVRASPVPHEMAATADGAELFVTNYGVKTFHDTDIGANTLTVVDPRRMAVAGTVDLGANRRPHGIARGRSGRFYVTTDQPPELVAIDPKSRAVVARYPIGQALPHMVVVTPDERRAVVACSGSGTISIVPIEDAPHHVGHIRDIRHIRHIRIGGTPMGLALSTGGRWLYATNRDGNQVVLLDMRTERIVRAIPVAGEPARAAFGPGERVLIVSAIGAGDVAVIDTQTFKEIARLHVGRRPEALLIDAERGRGFVSVQDDDKVVEFSLAGWSVSREIKTGDHPDALWLDRAGTVDPQSDQQSNQIDGNAVNMLAADRLARRPAGERAAWSRYLQTSARWSTADRASIDAELRAAGKDRMTPATYRKAFQVEPSMSPAWFRGPDGRRMAETVMSFQTPSGGWSKHVDLTGRPRQPGESYYSETAGWSYIATFDNDSTTEQLRFLGGAFDATGDPRVRASFLRGLDYLAEAQLPNGCWPQVYPLQGGYHDAITFNDNAVVNVMRLLDDVAAGRYAAATPPAAANSARRAAAATARGLACILATQVRDGGVRTIWAQQNDPLTMEPVAARRYELAGLAGRESAAVTVYLMSLPTPAPDVVEAVHAAAGWFRAHALSGYDYDVKTGLRKAPDGELLWARLSELGTARPIFSNRDGIKRYDWNDLTDRRFGYSWFGREPAAMLARYEAWARTHPRPITR